MRFFPARSVNLKSAAAVPAALAVRPADAMERAQAAAAEILEAVERGRSVASELVEAARSAMPIEAIRPARRRGRRAMAFTCLAVTAAAATAAYVWWKRHDSVDITAPDMTPAASMPRDPMAPMTPDTNEPGGSFNAAVPPTQTTVLPGTETPRMPDAYTSAPPPSTHPSPMHTSQPPTSGARFAMPSNRGTTLPYGRLSLP
jgi:hypothetical protein